LSAKALVQSGKVRALAAAPGKRIAAMPDLPTIAEAGVPGYQFEAWFGIVAPAGTPKPVIDKLNQDLRHVLTLPQVREVFDQGGFEPVGSSVESFANLIPGEIERWGKLVRETGAKVE
jgi:tripartite-type tricarboxylate transporter receptor subunit TctC